MNALDKSSDVLCSFDIKTPAATFTKVSIQSVIAVIITGYGTFLIQGILGSFFCKISSFLADVSLSVSTHSLAMITVERFMAVAFPFTVRQMSSKLRFYAILIVRVNNGHENPCTFYYFYTFRLTEWGDCASNWEQAFDHELTHIRYYTALFVVVVNLPFTAITILYSVILWTLIIKKDEPSLRRSGKGRENRDELKHLKVSRIAAAIFIVFALCWAPFNVQQFMILFARMIIPQCSLVFSVYSEAAVVLALMYCIVNPVICFIFLRSYPLRVRFVNRK